MQFSYKEILYISVGKKVIGWVISMGNFFVEGLRYSGTSLYNGVLADVTGSVSKSVPSLFNTARDFFPSLSGNVDNVFTHTFVTPSAATSASGVIDFFPALSGKTAGTTVSAPVSTGSFFSFIDDYIPDFFTGIIPKVSNGIRRIASQVVNTGADVISGVGSFISGCFGRLINFAKSFVGRVNSDREGNRIFSNGRSQAWCADFVTYCVKKVFGNKLPSDFGSSAVSDLRAWGDKHGCYLKAPYENGKAAMANFLKNRVKPGDIMIEKRNGKSHTGIVTYVDPNGQYFKTVEGNASDSVKEVTYKADSKTLSGFVSLSKFA